MSEEFVVESHLGATDCSDCQIFRHENKIFAKLVWQSRKTGPNMNASLPIKIAELPSVRLAEIALAKIEMAIKRGDTIIDLRDLESIVL